MLALFFFFLIFATFPPPCLHYAAIYDSVDTALGCTSEHSLAIDFTWNITQSALFYLHLKHLKYLFKTVYVRGSFLFVCLQLIPASTDIT